MREHEFTLVLKTDPSDQASDALYAIFSDGTISTIAGVPRIHFHREAKTINEAIRSALSDVRSTKIEIERVELQPEAIAQAT